MDHKNKAIFLDRDGTLIVDYGYIKDPSKVELLPHTIDALKLFIEHGYILLIVTNQSGVGRGLMTMNDVTSINKKLISLLRGINISEILICPHTPEDDCSCRKPKLGLVKPVLEKYDIDAKKSFTIGDKSCDKELAEGFGGIGIKLGEDGLHNLMDVAKKIIGENSNNNEL